MDFSFDLSHVFPDKDVIVKVGSDMLPKGLDKSSIHFRMIGLMQQRVSEILDRMGELSAIAQGLKASITTGEKVRNHPEHSVYLLLDRESNAGRGSVVGLLKVGRKNLFLIDKSGNQNEVFPMCILDFYVHESRQRTGCGKILFEHMLKDLNIHPGFMAIDRPSPKLLGFLKKYYGLDSMIPQVNNYVIFDGFFSVEHLTQTHAVAKGVVDLPSNQAPTPRRPRIYMGKIQYV